MNLDVLADWYRPYRRVEFLVARDFRAFCESAGPNVLDVPEIRHYHRDEREGVTITTYEQRQPGERDWQPIRLVKLV